MANWFGKVKGHIGEAKGRFDTDARQRAKAEAAKKSVILTDRMLQTGQLDASNVLYTTLNGGLTEITANELATFRHNMQIAKRQAGFSSNGIKARQVIDLASSAPLKYARGQPGGAHSDIDKARREITTGVPVSARHDTVRFITNAGGSEPGVSRHHVTIQLLGFRNAVDAIVASGGDPATLRKEANKMRKAGLKFDCDCKRHRFFLRYVATIGGFNAGRDETGFPKIRNPGLKGVACKHVLRVMTELESSGSVLLFLEKHLKSVSAYKANTTVKQAGAEETVQKAPAIIKTSEQRAAEAKAARDRRAKKQAAAAPKARPVKKDDPYTRLIDKAIRRGSLNEYQVSQMRSWGWSDKRISNTVE